MSHSLIEAAMNRFLYLILDSEYPHLGKTFNAKETEENENLNREMQENLWRVIEEMNFMGKFRLIEPCLKITDPDLIEQIRNINRVRNRIAHLKKIADLKFTDKLIWSEEGLEEFFATSQCGAWEIDKLWERIDDQHARCEKWAKRLKELGEPILTQVELEVTSYNLYYVNLSF
jgi:hypothetical protein